MTNDRIEPTALPALNGHPPGESVDALKRRVEELEAALAKMTRQREETRRMLFELHAAALPDDPPPTEEELIEEKKTRTEQSISSMLANVH